MNQLAKVENITAVEVFTSGNAESLINAIESEVRSFIPDLKTVKSRKEIASLSAKVSKSKVVLDNLGKTLVSDWKTKAKAVDSERKMVRDRLDSLRDEVRQPLTEWEEAEKARIEAERMMQVLLEAHEQAIAEDDLYNRQKAIEAKEEEQRQIEAARVAKEEAERIELERIEREKQIAVEAAENAKREAEELAAKEKAEAEQKIIDAKAAIELEKLKAKEAAERAEQEKIQAIKDAEEKAKREAMETEQKRLAEEARVKSENDRIAAEAEKKAANKKHQAAINNKILKQFSAIGIEENLGKKLITAIAKLEVDYLSIRY